MKKVTALILTALLTLTLLSGCGSSVGNKTAANDSWYFSETSDSIYYEDADYDFDEIAESEWSMSESPIDSSDSISATTEYVESERKIIKTRSIEMQTTEFDEFIRQFEFAVKEYGGYVESASQSGSKDAGRRYSNYIVRIPAEKFDEFTSKVGDLGTVTYSNEYIDDVTESYVDIEARLSALDAQLDAYMKLMDKAESIEDILQIQQYITEVTYQIESYTARLNSYKSKIAYSTLELSLSEVTRVTVPTEKKTVWQRISANLSDNMYDIGEDFKDFFVSLVSALPYILLYAVIFGIIALIIIIPIKKAKKKKAALNKNQEQQ